MNSSMHLIGVVVDKDAVPEGGWPYCMVLVDQSGSTVAAHMREEIRTDLVKKLSEAFLGQPAAEVER